MNLIYIGGAPAESLCASLGVTPDFDQINRIECNAYIVALRRKFGEPPEGACFRVKKNSHDFGAYREVVMDYDDTLAAVDYACEAENGLAKWADGRMHAPVLYYDSADCVISTRRLDTFEDLFEENVLADVAARREQPETAALSPT